MGVFDGCLVGEELGFGCTGIMTAMESSGLGVSSTTNISQPFLCQTDCNRLEFNSLNFRQVQSETDMETDNRLKVALQTLK